MNCLKVFKMNEMIKTTIFFVITILITMLSMELICRLLVPDFKNAMTHVLKRTKPMDDLTDGILENLTNIKTLAKAPHPYFGHVYNRALSSNINRDGFEDDLDFSNLEKGYFYIGVFGGSVATDFALHHRLKTNLGKKNFLSKLKHSLPRRFNGKNIKILNFAVAAYKQPQQFLTSTFYLDRIDMAITIDGYNEIAQEIYREFPAEYPSFSNLFYSLDMIRNKYLFAIY